MFNIIYTHSRQDTATTLNWMWHQRHIEFSVP